MNEERMKTALESVARRGVPENTNLWPRIAARIERKTIMQTLRAKPALLFLVLLLALTLLTGVAYAIGKSLGYIYVPQANTFLPADTTFIIKQPVMQEHDGRHIVVRQGIATPSQVTLWLEFSETARPVDGAILKTLDGTEVALTYWEYSPNEPASRSVKMTFAPLPSGTMQTTLSLPEGWQIPLEWVPLSAAQKPESAISSAPYPPTSISTTETPCVESHALQLCVLTATQSEGKTIVLVEAKSLGGQLAPGGDFMSELVWQDENSSVAIVAAQGNTFPMELAQPARLSDTPGSLTAQLTFSGVPTDGQPVKLIIPGFYASVDVNQSVTVDLGDDPQPGTIPVNSDIQVLGQTIRFRTGTLIGDGVTGLRLYLDSEPVTKLDGIEPYSLELGKPERIDDLFGSGNLAGSKDLFVELIQSSGKITGQLVLPVTKATVVIHGPFELNLTVSSTPLETPVPAVANPGNFIPAPTPTPLSLDSYFYSGQSLNPGDLLYAVWNGGQTDIYRLTPASGGPPTLFATLPGHAAYLHLHPDRQGLDYIAGTFNPESNGLNGTKVYTLRFAHPKPRFLHTAPDGNIYWPTWSSDGRLLAFAIQLPDPGETHLRIAWIDMNCRSTGECPIQFLDAPREYELYHPVFAPQGYTLAISGVETAYGAGEIYLLPFDENAQPGKLQNVTNTDQAYDSHAAWSSGNNLVWQCITGDPGKETTSICLKDLLSANTAPQTVFSYNDSFEFGLSDAGSYFWQVIINRQARKEMQLWMYQRGGSGRMLAAAPWFDTDYATPAFSPDENYLAFVTTVESFKTGPETLHLTSASSGQDIIVYYGRNPIGWLGWVR